MTAKPAFGSPAVVAAALTAAAALLSLAASALITGFREQRNRRRDQFSRAFAACVRYQEFPYVVRRRRSTSPEGERHRISEELRNVQEELAYHSVWMRTESGRVARAYERLVGELRRVAGGQIHEAWLTEPAASDEAMNMPDLGLSVLHSVKEAYLMEVADRLSLLPGWILRAGRRLRRAAESPGSRGY